MNKAFLTARRLLASVLVEDVRRLADAVGRLQEGSQTSNSLSQDMSEGVPRPSAPADMVAEADRLASEGLEIRWPLDATQIFRALNSYLAEPEGQLLLEVGGEPVAPKPPSMRCENCGEPAAPTVCDACGKVQTLCGECAIEAVGEDGGEATVCPECAEDLKECHNCDKLIMPGAEVTVSGDECCAACAEEDSTVCDDCGDRDWNDNMTHVESSDKSVCDSCRQNNYGHCEGCQQTFPDDEMHYGDASLCDDCWGERMTTCQECGEEILIEDANYDEDEGGYFCSDCYTGGNLHEDVTDLGVDFDREVESDETPLAERLGVLLRLIGERGRMPISRLKKSHPGLAASIMAELDINKLADGNAITRELVEAARDGIEETFAGLRVSLGEWGGVQRLYNKNNLVFRLDARDVIDELENRDGSADEGSEERAAANLLEAAVDAGMSAHPIMPKSTIGWARVVPIDDTWYIEELQSDFDADAGRIRRYVKSEGKTEKLPSSVSAEDVRLGWPLVRDLLDNWEHYLLAKVAGIARENGVKTLAVISKRQLDEWAEEPPPGAYDTVGKTRSDSKRKRYYRDAPKGMGFTLEQTDIGGLEQKAWLRAASKRGMLERIPRLVAFELSLGLLG